MILKLSPQRNYAHGKHLYSLGGRGKSDSTTQPPALLGPPKEGPFGLSPKNNSKPHRQSPSLWDIQEFHCSFPSRTYRHRLLHGLLLVRSKMVGRTHLKLVAKSVGFFKWYFKNDLCWTKDFGHVRNRWWWLQNTPSCWGSKCEIQNVPSHLPSTSSLSTNTWWGSSCFFPTTNKTWIVVEQAYPGIQSKAVVDCWCCSVHENPCKPRTFES